jgi:hypothetical protein
MQGKQHVPRVVVQDHRRGGEVAGGTGPRAAIRAGGEKGQERLLERGLARVRRPPSTQGAFS